MFDFYCPEGFLGILHKIVYSGVDILTVAQYPNIDKGLVLRHDLDSEMETALEVAEVEYNLGVKSSFFFLLTSPFYNIAAKEEREIINEISKMGHEIGLHFDPEAYNNKADLDACVVDELIAMEMIIKHTIISVSLHNPSHRKENNFFNDLTNAYNSEVFKGGENYFSDSGFSINWEKIDKAIEQGQIGLSQLLLHPTIYFLRESKDKPQGVIPITKMQIKRHGQRRISDFNTHPMFSNEVKSYPIASFNVNFTLLG